MTESPRVYVLQAELEKNIGIWLTLLAQRQPSILRDLWTRRGEDFDRPKQEHARRELARFLASKILYGSHVLTREATAIEAQASNHDLMKLAPLVK